MKVFGGDLATLERHRDQDQSGDVDGSRHNRPRDFRRARPAHADHRYRPERAARYGLAPGDVNATIQAGIGGQAAGNLYEAGSDRNFPIVVRLKPEYRQSVDAIRNLALNVANPGGSGNIQIPLSEVARVSLASGPAMIYREQQERYVPIKFGVRKRDLAGAVREAQAKVAAEVQLPRGLSPRVGRPVPRSDRRARTSRLHRAAEHRRDSVAAARQLPSFVDMALAATAMPMALIGGIFALGAHRHAIQRVGGDRFRRPVRHRRHGGHHHSLVFQSPHR